MCLFDLDELGRGEVSIPVNRNGILTFQTKRHLCCDGHPSGTQARQFVRKYYPELNLDGSVTLLTNPKLFGLNFNPLSIYFLHNFQEQPAALIYEVSNTPWNEFHRYVIPAEQIMKRQRARFDKVFYVSPFNPMAQYYQTEVIWPSSDRCSIYLSLTNNGEDQPMFEAGLDLKLKSERPTIRSLFIGIWPQTLLVLVAIYKEAFALWRKGLTYHSHS